MLPETKTVLGVGGVTVVEYTDVVGVVNVEEGVGVKVGVAKIKDYTNAFSPEISKTFCYDCV
jgi:hypothetical protein